MFILQWNTSSPLLMWAGNRERALQSHLKGNVSWKRGIFNQRPGSKKKNIAESEEPPEWALLSRSIPVLTCLPPLIISTQFRSYIITAWISNRLSSCTATLGIKSARWGGWKPPQHCPLCQSQLSRASRHLALSWAVPGRILPCGQRVSKHLLSDVCVYHWLTDHCMEAFHYGFTKFLNGIF